MHSPIPQFSPPDNLTVLSNAATNLDCQHGGGSSYQDMYLFGLSSTGSTPRHSQDTGVGVANNRKQSYASETSFHSGVISGTEK